MRKPIWQASIVYGLFLRISTGAPPPKIFSHPQQACALLEQEGFSPAVWQATSFGYECTTTNLRIDYIVSGDDHSKAKRLKLRLDLGYESRDAPERRAEFDRVATVMLSRLGLKASRGLHQAISSIRQFRETQSGANITFDPGRRPFSTPTLIVRESSTRVVTIPRTMLVPEHPVFK